MGFLSNLYFILDMQSKQWHFPLAQYNNVVAVLKKMSPSVSISELPQLVLDVSIMNYHLQILPNLPYSFLFYSHVTDILTQEVFLFKGG